jgi:hypothetical protein
MTKLYRTWQSIFLLGIWLAMSDVSHADSWKLFAADVRGWKFTYKMDRLACFATPSAKVPTKLSLY